MLTDQMGAELSKAFENALIAIFTIYVIILAVGVNCLIVGIILFVASKKSDKAPGKVTGIVLIVVGALMLLFVAGSILSACLNY